MSKIERFISDGIPHSAMGSRQNQSRLWQMLNSAEMREFLRQNIPLVEYIEAKEISQEIRLRGVTMRADAPCVIFYESRASREAYPDVAEALMRRGIVKGGNVLSSNLKHAGQPDEHESLHFGFHGNTIQIFLKAYHPGYAGFKGE